MIQMDQNESSKWIKMNQMGQNQSLKWIEIDQNNIAKARLTKIKQNRENLVTEMIQMDQN